MRVPMSWLRELVTLPPNVTTAQVADALTRAGLQVERIERSGVEVSGPVVVGRVLEFTEQPQRNGKVIRWCQVDVGELAPRGVICGARNFESGDHVVVALPGAVLPGGFEITARKTYGRVSDGMICAEDELGLGTDHNGIMVLPEQVNGRPQVLGADAMVVLQARDEVLEIDVTPDIGYCLSMRGIARETAQAFGVAFTDPYLIGRVGPSEGGYPIRLESENCTVFVALTIEDVDPDAPTPTWMAARLVAAGMRSISLDVDITNYVMLESGQPLHAYDADRLQGPIVVRQAAPGERLTTLDDVVRKLSPDDLLITDDSGPIGLAGVMGGQTTELTPTTRNIVLEAARFDPVTIGRTFRRHKLPSEASARFSRGVDPALPLAAARMAARLMAELGGGTVSDSYTVVGAAPASAPATRAVAALRLSYGRAAAALDGSPDSAAPTTAAAVELRPDPPMPPAMASPRPASRAAASRPPRALGLRGWACGGGAPQATCAWARAGLMIRNAARLAAARRIGSIGKLRWRISGGPDRRRRCAGWSWRSSRPSACRRRSSASSGWR